MRSNAAVRVNINAFLCLMALDTLGYISNKTSTIKHCKLSTLLVSAELEYPYSFFNSSVGNSYWTAEPLTESLWKSVAWTHYGTLTVKLSQGMYDRTIQAEKWWNVSPEFNRDDDRRENQQRWNCHRHVKLWVHWKKKQNRRRIN